MSFYRTRTQKNSRVLDILISQGERACRLFFYPCLKQVEPKLYSKIRKYISEVNESIEDARRQLVGYLLEKDKVWFENSSEQHQEKKHSPRRKNQEQAIKKKGKETQLSRAAKPRKDHADVGIFDAVAKGYLSELERTLKYNDINALNSSSETLLHVAAANGHLTIMEYLISKGAKIDVKDKKGRTPLHGAAEKGHAESAEVLIEKGADFSIKTPFVTPLHIASQRGNTDVAQQLLYHKANVNVKDKESKTPLHFAAERGDKAMVEMLLNANADPNAQDKEKKTPLHTAAVRGHLGIVKVLLANKGRHGAKDMDGCTPIDLINLLLKEQRVPKTLLTRCCFQDTVRCYTDIQYLAGPSLDISVLYPMTWY
uniref:Uncharacterized protein n=1 Tax=Aquila chrysaetos chrysaetos TaxID=223781 RepID=A0A663FKD5_AQUCH